MDNLPPELGGGSVEDPSARTRVVKNKYNLACQVRMVLVTSLFLASSAGSLSLNPANTLNFCFSQACADAKRKCDGKLYLYFFLLTGRQLQACCLQKCCKKLWCGFRHHASLGGVLFSAPEHL